MLIMYINTKTFATLCCNISLSSLDLNIININSQTKSHLTNLTLSMFGSLNIGRNLSSFEQKKTLNYDHFLSFFCLFLLEINLNVFYSVYI